MIYELRVYEAIPGKLPALHQRFTDHTTRLFAKHGIVAVGYWTTYIGPSVNTLTYLLAWQDLGDREQRWDAFQADPEWQAVKAHSEQDGPLIAQAQSTILRSTPYSPLHT